MIEPDQFKNSEAVSGEEENFERALRPKKLEDYVGQEKIRLGLSFCKLVMKDFGGNISVKSVENCGVDFCLRF